MEELSRSAPREGDYRVYLVGGGSAVYFGWRKSSLDADLWADDDSVFRDMPPLKGSAERHELIDRMGNVTFYHYDPYAQALSKIVRGFDRDLIDARCFIRDGLVAPQILRELVNAIPESTYAKYPNLSPSGVQKAVDSFLSGL